MWFSEKALVFVDTRSAALAVYKQGFSGPRLERFAFERFGSHASQGALFSDVLADSKSALGRLARDLKAPTREATLLLPLGASFPSVVDTTALRKGQAGDVDEEELVRFRLGPLLPFPIAQAEVQTETTTTTSIGSGTVLAQAILKTTIAESEKGMASLGFPGVRISSALSAALRGLPPLRGAVDLIFGDSAYAIVVRSAGGAIDAIHLRLLLEGDDRAQRSVDEGLRATADAQTIRVLGEDADLLRAKAPTASIQPAFTESPLKWAADPQQFPFLALFHAGGKS